MFKKQPIAILMVLGALLALFTAQLGLLQPPLPQFSIDSVRQAEGDSGTTPFVFTVTRDDASVVSTVNYATEHGPNSTNDTDLTLINGTLTFNVGELSHTITVLVNGDTDRETHEHFRVVLSNPVEATIQTAVGIGTIINDDGAPGVLFDPLSLSVTEGGATQDYHIILWTQPSAPVTVAITSDAQCTVSPASITVDSTNFDRSAPITVTAVDDTVAEGNHICRLTHTITSADADYNGLTVQALNVSVIDNDSAGAGYVIVDPNVIRVHEGGFSDTVNIRLSATPNANVLIGLNPDLQCFTHPSTITLNSSNYAAGVDVRITAVDDTQEEGSHHCNIGVTVSSTDSRYNNAIVSDIIAMIIDNDGNWAYFTPNAPGGPGQWTPAPVVTFAPTFTPMPTYTPTMTPVPLIGVVSSEVSRLAMRSGPYLYATLLGGIDAGATHPIIAQSSDEGSGIVWYLVQTEHVTGWVSGRYMTFNQPPNYPHRGSIFDEIDGAPDTGVTVTTLTLNDLRRRPSGRTASLGQIPADTTLQLLGRTRQSGSDFWYHVRYEGQVGWIPAYGIVRGSIRDVPIR